MLLLLRREYPPFRLSQILWNFLLLSPRFGFSMEGFQVLYDEAKYPSGAPQPQAHEASLPSAIMQREQQNSKAIIPAPNQIIQPFESNTCDTSDTNRQYVSTIFRLLEE